MFAIMIVRNEESIILNSIGHLLRHLDVDGVLVADNGSSDGTPALLGRIARHDERLRWHARPGRFDQHHIMSDLAEAARRAGADWVLPVDADEFFDPGPQGFAPLDQADGVGAFTVPVRNFVQHRSLHRLFGRRDPAKALRSMIASAEPVGEWEAARRLVESRQIPFVSITYPPKLLFRPAQGVALERGCHGAAGVAGEIRPWPGGAFLHAPIRTFGDLGRRMEHGQRLAEADPDPAIGWHLRRLVSFAGQEVRREWHANTTGLRPIGRRGRRLRFDLRLSRIDLSLRDFRAEILQREPPALGLATATA